MKGELSVLSCGITGVLGINSFQPSTAWWRPRGESITTIWGSRDLVNTQQLREDLVVVGLICVRM